MLISPNYLKQKPRSGTRFDPSHPLALAMICQYAMTDGGQTLLNSARQRINTPLTGSPVYAVGKYGTALSLNGSGQYGVLPVTGTGLSGWSGTGITLAMAFRITSTPSSFTRIFEKGNNSEITVQVNTGSSDSKVTLQVLGGSGTGVVTSTNYNDGKTHIVHVSITSGLAATLYLDGTAVGTTSSGTPASYTNDVQLGRNTLAGHFFPGLVEGFWAWNRPLSASEVRLHAFDPFCMFQPKRRPRLFPRSATTLFRRTQFDRVGSRGAS